MQAPPIPPPQDPAHHCPNCGYPVQGHPQHCPTCGFRLRKPASSCRLTLSIILLVLFSLVGGTLLFFAACAAGLSNNHSDVQTVNQWGFWFLGGVALLLAWMIYEIVRKIRLR